MQTSTLNRGIQFALAVIILAISAVVLKKTGSLSDAIDELNSLVNATNDTLLLDLFENDGLNLTSLDLRLKKRDLSLLNSFDNLTLSSTGKPILISLLSGSLTSGSHTTIYGSSFLNISPPNNAGQTSLGLSKSQLLYLTSLVGSEAGSVGLWFTSSIYQASMYGNWQCGDVQSLLLNYNLTDSTYPDSILSNFFGIEGGSGIPNVPSMINFTSINTNNLTTMLAQSELLLKLSADCQMRKATLSLSVLGSLTYFLSSGIMVTSAVAFYRNLQEVNKTKVPINLIYEDPMNFPKVDQTESTDSEVYFDSV